MTTGMSIAMGGTVIEPRAGPIPYTAMASYAKDHGFDDGPVGFEFFLDQIHRLDREYLAWESERAKERAQEAAARRKR